MVLKKLVDTASIENTISIKIGSLISSFILKSNRIFVSKD